LAKANPWDSRSFSHASVGPKSAYRSRMSVVARSATSGASMVARPPTFARDKPARAFGGISRHEPLHLPQAQTQALGSLTDAQHSIGHRLDRLESIDFAHAHRDGGQVRHVCTSNPDWGRRLCDIST
jgi:hypothetical protein